MDNSRTQNEAKSTDQTPSERAMRLAEVIASAIDKTMPNGDVLPRSALGQLIDLHFPGYDDLLAACQAHEAADRLAFKVGYMAAINHAQQLTFTAIAKAVAS